jgi:transcription-repair coupling factor (superfamily II helicase)
VGGGAGATVPTGEGDPRADVRYIEDTVIETDAEAVIPDDYVGQAAEKLKLYRALDAMTDEGSMERFTAELVDRFGPIPPETETLMNVVRLRWLAIVLGFERVKVKNGLAILSFPSDSTSAYYKSAVFEAIMGFVATKKDKFVLRQNNNKLALTVRNVSGIADAVETLKQMANG